MQRTYIFDYGATIDSPGNHWGKILWHAYERAEVPVTEEQFRAAYVYGERYLGAHEIIERTDTFKVTLEKKLTLQLDWLFWEKQISMDVRCGLREKILEDVYSLTLKNIEESRGVLQTLKERGCRLGLVSNFYGNIEAVLEEFRLKDFFDAVVESATEGIRKPDPRLLALTMERLGARPEETVVVGDHLAKDIAPAKQLGCRAVWIKGEPWSQEHDELDIAPDSTITNLKELLAE